MRRAIAALVLCGGLALASFAIACPAGAVDSGTPAIHATDSIYHGLGTTIAATGLTPDASYTVTASAGTWVDDGDATTTGSADQTGYLKADLELAYSAPASVRSVEITVTADGDTDPTVSASIPVAVPEISPDNVSGFLCPGQTFHGIEAFAFADGTYTLHSPDATFSPSTLTVHSDQPAGQVTVTAANDAPSPIPITLTTGTGSARTVLQSTISRGAPGFSEGQASTPWQLRWNGGCLPRNSVLTVGPHPGYVDLPRTVHVDARGHASVVESLHPGRAPRHVPPVVLTETTGETVALRAGLLPGTRVRSGRSLDGINYLVSARPGYQFDAFCTPLVIAYQGANEPGVIWQADVPNDPLHCSLLFTARGDLQVRYQGHVFWSTHTRGSDGGNRLIMRDDGALAIVTAAGRTIWTSTDGSTGGAR